MLNFYQDNPAQEKHISKMLYWKSDTYDSRDQV